ncbi:hypothetical protein ACFRAR_27540 [Kitasatospora sp. NPDC056651]|uniref:hypothetical protein n=1 Tax=Kitasatospora sp. NPDC056651 TaxID=3345892 RepID=UPI0036AACAD8
MTTGIALTLATAAGCSSGSPSDRAAPTGAISAVPTLTVAATDYLPRPTPTPVAPSIDPSIVLGSALKAYLPTAETVPSGWTLNTKLGPATPHDSGAQVLSGTTGLGPTAPCGVMNNMTVLDGEAAYASQQMRSTDGNEYAALVTVDSFRTGQAAQQLAVIRDFAARCPSFTEKGTGTGHSDVEVRLVAKPLNGLGDEALDFKMLPEGNYLGNETVLVRIGDRVLNLRCGADKYGDFPDTAALAQELAKLVK